MPTITQDTKNAIWSAVHGSKMPVLMVAKRHGLGTFDVFEVLKAENMRRQAEEAAYLRAKGLRDERTDAPSADDIAAAKRKAAALLTAGTPLRAVKVATGLPMTTICKLPAYRAKKAAADAEKAAKVDRLWHLAVVEGASASAIYAELRVSRGMLERNLRRLWVQRRPETEFVAPACLSPAPKAKPAAKKAAIQAAEAPVVAPVPVAVVEAPKPAPRIRAPQPKRPLPAVLVTKAVQRRATAEDLAADAMDLPPPAAAPSLMAAIQARLAERAEAAVQRTLAEADAAAAEVLEQAEGKVRQPKERKAPPRMRREMAFRQAQLSFGF